jgi:HD-GYP domain-containing protein (c-di-GMP phosphodiesterase class II)
MEIDSYANPDAEALLRLGQERQAERRRARRVLVTEAVGAGAFLAGAGCLAVLAPWDRALSVPALVVSVLTYVIAGRVRFPVGSAWTAPTQLVFVPMLFVLPTPLVPLIIAACSLVDLWPMFLARRFALDAVFGRIGDSFYSLGPALVLVLAGAQVFHWTDWHVWVIAFVAQMLFDAGAGLGRTWCAERVLPSVQLPMLWLYVTDACLSCAGLLVAASAVDKPGLILLVMPLLALLAMFARERQQRLDHTLELSSAYRGTALLLGDVVESDDAYTGIHSRQVVDLATAVAEALGLDGTRRRNVEFTALLHDVGKIRVPKEIINKPGKLDEREWEIMRRHTIEGEAMLKRVGGTLSSVGRLVRSCHERYDGGGYPDGIEGTRIPIESRIVCACDAYNAMTTDRPYRGAMEIVEAIAELRRCAGTQFDPAIVEAMVEVLLRPGGRESIHEQRAEWNAHVGMRLAVPGGDSLLRTMPSAEPQGVDPIAVTASQVETLRLPG